MSLVECRLYNQPVGPDGKGLLYKGFFDTVVKLIQSEGLFGLYKVSETIIISSCNPRASSACIK